LLDEASEIDCRHRVLPVPGLRLSDCTAVGNGLLADGRPELPGNQVCIPSGEIMRLTVRAGRSPVWPIGIAGGPTDAGGNQALRFVRRGGILLQRGKAICVVFPPPSLGVSSLDWGRLHPRAALFSSVFWGACDRAAIPRTRAAAALCGDRDAAMRYNRPRNAWQSRSGHSAAAR